MSTDDANNTHDPYDTSDLEAKATEVRGLPPVINREKDPAQDDVFHKAMAKSYKVDPSQIVVRLSDDKLWKIYEINGKQIFKIGAGS
jgi:hypothetical protein